MMPLNPTADYVTAAPLAALAPAVVAAALAWSAGLLPIAFGIALAHMAILGLPLFLVLRWTRRLNAMTATAAGFIIGVVPLGLWGAVDPIITGSAVMFTVDPVIACLATLLTPGWTSYLRLGALGALGGFTFWLVLQLLARWETAKQTGDAEHG